MKNKQVMDSTNPKNNSTDKHIIYSFANELNLRLYYYINELPKEQQDDAVRSVITQLIKMYNGSSYKDKI